MAALSKLSCVIFLSNDTGKTGHKLPLMLQNIMGTPLLTWLTGRLAENGCRRFFLLCPEEFLPQAETCFPAGVSLTCARGEDASDQLHVFLSTAQVEEKDVTVITQPVLLLPKTATADFRNAPVPTRAFAVNRRALMDALDARFSFQDFFAENGKPMTDRDGWYAVTSAEQLADWQAIYNRDTLCRLVNQGVEVWDYHSCHVDPDVFVGKGSVLLPGTILKNGTVIGRNCRIGPNAFLSNAKVDDGAEVNASQVFGAIVGANSTVGPFAHVRPGTVIGRNCRVGDFVEVKNSTIGDDAVIRRLSFVGDSDLGLGVTMGCGTVTANHDPAQTHRTVIGDHAYVECGSRLIAPLTLGKNARVAAGSTVTENVPEDALVTERGQTVLQRDWNKPHKTQK